MFLGGPLSAVGGALLALGKGVVALRNIELMGFRLSSESDVDGRTAGFALARPEPLGLVSLFFTYRESEGDEGHGIGPIDFRFDPGELIFATGGNGSGKTTLALC
jgi:putative ATP-binding cassette transporter